MQVPGIEEAIDWRQVGTMANLKSDSRVEYSVVGPTDGEPYFEIEGGPRFSLWEIRDSIGTPYSIPKPDGGFRPLSSFTEGQIRALYPFALVLACLDGNAFVNHERPENDLVRQYVPQVFATLEMNGCVTLTDDGAAFRSDRT